MKKKCALYSNSWMWLRNKDWVGNPSVVRYSSSLGCCNTVLFIIEVLIQFWTSKSAGFTKKMLR
jgi:hypothetical protein